MAVGKKRQDRMVVESMVGKRFAYREHAHTPGEPLCPVEVVKEGPKRLKKVRVRWLDGEYEGLEEWVPRVRLVVPWEEVEAFLEDEHRVLAAAGASGDVHGSIEWKAVQQVFFALPVAFDIMLGYKALEQDLLTIDSLDAAIPVLGVSKEELLAEPHAFIDRFGEYKAPFPAAVRVAKHCCKRFARDILHYINGEEDALRQATISRYYVSPHSDGREHPAVPERIKKHLREEEPVFALIRT